MTNSIVFREAGPADLEDVYDICLKTGDAGKDATGLYTDPRILGHIYAAPYLQLEAGIHCVAEDRDGVLGYAVGAADTRVFEELLETHWWPDLRRIYPAPQGDPSTFTMDEKRVYAIHHPSLVPEHVVKDFPAHIHMNVLPRAQGKGIGSRLLINWLEQAQRNGAEAVHAGVSSVNENGLGFWRASGFEPIEEDLSAGTRGAVWCGRKI